MPELNDAPSIIDVPGGHPADVLGDDLATGTEAMSVAHMQAPRGWTEPAQRPDFDEVTVVVSGTVLVEHEGGTTTVAAGQSIVTRAGERVRYSTGPDGAEYVAICTPAFAPDTVHREEQS